MHQYSRRRLSFVFVLASPIAALASTIALAQEVRTYFVLDTTGSPVAATDSYANVTWSEDFLPYGERRVFAVNSSDNEAWFTGGNQNQDTGLLALGHRYYDPVIGRFLSIDPINVSTVDGSNFNRYWYANNNPYKFIDPDGRDITCASTSCTLNPTGTDLPSITYPKQKGHSASINSTTILRHEYRFETSAGRGDSSYRERLINVLLNNATNVAGQAASSKGTRNDVNVDNAVSWITFQDHVVSYAVDLPGGGRAVLNVTEADHAGKWGAVLRVVQSREDGTQTIVTYGEGNSLLQRLFDPTNADAKEVWDKSSTEIVRKANEPK